MQAYEIIEKIEKLRLERGWTTYRLAETAGIAQSTIFNMNSRNTLPSITTLSCLCDAFGITLADFFSDGQNSAVSSEEKALIEDFRKLSYQNKQAVKNLVKSLK